MKDSIVAMSGAIMPAPLAMPLMVTLALPSFTVAVATFGKVSVVMIAFAASSQSSASRVPASMSAAPTTRVRRSTVPLTAMSRSSLRDQMKPPPGPSPTLSDQSPETKMCLMCRQWASTNGLVHCRARHTCLVVTSNSCSTASLSSSMPSGSVISPGSFSFALGSHLPMAIAS